MEQIGQINNCCSSKVSVHGCANGVPYLMLVNDGCCDDVLKYINLNTGEITDVRPTGFEVGECSELVDSNICFEFTVNGVVINIRAVYVNGVTTYYEDGVQVTDITRIAEIDNLMASASASNVVCCPDCTTVVPPYRTCWKAYDPTVLNVKTFGPFFDKTINGSTEAKYIQKLELKTVSPDAVVQTFDFTAAPIMYWNGTSWVDMQSVYDQLDAAGYFTAVENLLGCSGLKHTVVMDTATGTNSMYISTYQPQSTCDTQIAAHYVRFITVNASNVVVQDADSVSGNSSFVDKFNGTTFEAIYVDGVVKYYENGFEVTDAARISFLQSIVDAADPNSIVCCDDCGSEPTVVPPYKTCYKTTSSLTTSALYITYGWGITNTSKMEMGNVKLTLLTNPSEVLATIDVVPNIVFNQTGGPVETAASVQSQIEASNLLSEIQKVIPGVDSVEVTSSDSGGARTYYIKIYDSTNSSNSLIEKVNLTWLRYVNGATNNFWYNPNVLPLTGTTVAAPSTFEVYYINGVTTYFENGVEVTDATRLAELQAVVSAAAESDIVCCSDCTADAPVLPAPYKVCYPIAKTEEKTYSNWEYWDWALGFPNTPQYPLGTAKAINQFKAEPVFGSPTPTILNVTPEIPVWNGTSFLTAAQIEASLKASNFIAQMQVAEPTLNDVYVYTDGSGIPHIVLFNNAVANISNTNQVTGYQLNPPESGSAGYSYLLTGGTLTTVKQVSYEYSAVYNVDGTTDYYLDGVKLTDPAAILKAQAIISAAGSDGIGCCPDCAGGSDVTVTNTLASGHLIGNVNIDGTAYPINETVTTLTQNADGSITYVNEAGASVVIPQTICKSYFDTETFTATAGQTTFTLLNTPQGDVRFSRNGVALSDAAATVSGNVTTYVPSANNNQPLLANDRIEISYVYDICTSTASVPDGSETKVTAAAGSDITVTGSGTTASPYVISSNLSRIGDFIQLAVPTDQTVATGTVMNYSTQVAQNGSWVTQSGTSIILKAGGIYEVEAAAYFTGSAAIAFINYGIYANGVLTGTQGFVLPATHSTANQTGQSLAKAYIVANADTTINARIVQANVNFTLEGGALNGTNFTNFFTAKCIGVI